MTSGNCCGFEDFLIHEFSANMNSESNEHCHGVGLSGPGPSAIQEELIPGFEHLNLKELVSPKNVKNIAAAAPFTRAQQWSGLWGKDGAFSDGPVFYGLKKIDVNALFRIDYDVHGVKPDAAIHKQDVMKHFNIRPCGLGKTIMIQGVCGTIIKRLEVAMTIINSAIGRCISVKKSDDVLKNLVMLRSTVQKKFFNPHSLVIIVYTKDAPTISVIDVGSLNFPVQVLLTPDEVNTTTVTEVVEEQEAAPEENAKEVAANLVANVTGCNMVANTPRRGNKGGGRGRRVYGNGEGCRGREINSVSTPVREREDDSPARGDALLRHFLHGKPVCIGCGAPGPIGKGPALISIPASRAQKPYHNVRRGPDFLEHLEEVIDAPGQRKINDETYKSHGKKHAGRKSGRQRTRKH
ncbi:unnamed protein product [Caenorhabditis sp. 36 PRJEB53466]|nr:unnamed protein product [Caenorhabditis sp. 36 PRJEB53466]